MLLFRGKKYGNETEKKDLNDFLIIFMLLAEEIKEIICDFSGISEIEFCTIMRREALKFL